MDQFNRETEPPTLPIDEHSPKQDIVRLQQWLVVRDFSVGEPPGVAHDTAAAVGIDGSFGAATRAACQAFASASKLADATVNAAFWSALTGGMADAFGFRSKADRIGEAVIETAMAHLEQEPREARRLVHDVLHGADNTGPWVRAYCAGLSTEWCQGAASQWVKQAFAALGRPLPFPLDGKGILPLFVPSIVASAHAHGRLVLGSSNTEVPPGSFYFFKGELDGKPSHLHVGVTASPIGADGRFDAISGNTSTDGSSNGWVVRRGIMQRKACDFGLLSAPIEATS